MQKAINTCALSTLLALQTGCAAINFLAPEKDNSELTFKITDFKEGQFRTINFCPPKEIYMVMPEHGKVGIVEVTLNDGRQIILQGDYSAMNLQAGENSTYTGNQEQMQSLFGSSLSALPDKPLYQTVYFHPGTSKMLPKSKKAVSELLKDIANRHNPEIFVYGHTDTMGSDNFNKKLSTKRAEAVKSHLIASGIPAKAVQLSGFGETQLFVKTRDNVSEQKNRRVEISIR